MTLLGADFDAFFADSVDALRLYLKDVVYIGGCANALYRYHDLACDVPWGYLGTKDVDVAVPQHIPCEDRPPLLQLMSDIGFTELMTGNANEAVIKYGPAAPGCAVDLEFLCELSGLSKADQERAAVAVQKGIYAQPLRYLAMSLHNTWHVRLDRVPGFEKFRGIEIAVPNPAAYIVSKILIRGERRKPASTEKDCFYMYEVSVVFREALDAIREEYQLLEPCVPAWKKRFATDARALFQKEYSEGPVSATAVYKELGEIRGERFEVTEEIVHRSVNKLLNTLLN